MAAVQPAFDSMLFAHIVRSVSVTPSGKTAIVSCHDGNVVLLDISTGEVQRVLKGHTAEVYKAYCTPDANTVRVVVTRRRSLC